MTTRKREKMIKEIVDQEFGPNLTVDEICEGIDFSQRNGVRLTDPLKKKPFFKRPLVLTLANICLILICVLSTFLITKNDICIIDNYAKITNVLDEEEMKYLEDNEYKYNDFVNHMIFINSNERLFVFVIMKNEDCYCYVKKENNSKNNELHIYVNDENEKITLNNENDFINMGILGENKQIKFKILYKNSTNDYSIQLNDFND